MIDFYFLFTFIAGLLIGHFRLVDTEWIRQITNAAILERRYVIYCKIYPKRGNPLKHNCIVNLPLMINAIEYDAVLKQVRMTIAKDIKPEDPTYLGDSTIIIKSINILN